MSAGHARVPAPWRMCGSGWQQPWRSLPACTTLPLCRHRLSQTLPKPALLTADSNALTGPFGPGSVLDYFNKTPQFLEGTLYPVAAFQVTLGQLFYGLEPVRNLRQ